ncbi:MAG: SPOR domain-containing protein [Parvibaculaceae bacterium]
MSKKPASLTSDLLARKGEAEPSSIDPSARMTLTAGSGFDDQGGGRQEPYIDGDDERDDEPRYDAAPDIVTRRPVPPEPEIIYTAEETQSGGGNGRLLLIAILGLVIVGGIFLAMSGRERNAVAPVADVTPTENVAPVETGAPATDTTAAAPVGTAPEATSPETVTTTPPATGSAPMTISPNTPADVPTTVPAAPETQAASEVPDVAATPAPAAEVPATVAPSRPAAHPAAKVQSGGAYVVQLLALKDKAAAKAAWKKVSQKHAGVLANHALDIETADLGAKGTWYRVRAAGFASKAAATSACAKLKAAGQDCIAKKR